MSMLVVCIRSSGGVQESKGITAPLVFTVAKHLHLKEH